MKKVPEDVPSLVEIKRILPKHCFQPQLSKSFYYVFKDVAIIALVYAAYLRIETYTILVAPFYWYLQGTMFWAIFVLG